MYITAAWSVQTWSLLPVLWGTPFFNAVARFLGAKFKGKGRVLYLGDQYYDLPYLTIDVETRKDWCILDNAHRKPLRGKSFCHLNIVQTYLTA